MIRSTYYLGPDGGFEQELTLEQIRAALGRSGGLLWVDFCETSEEDGRLMAELFHFHHLAIEDCVGPRIDPPKADDYGDHLFVIVHGINHAQDSDAVETAELALFVGNNYVVSSHTLPLYSIEAVKHQVEDDGPPMKHGSDFLAHALVDSLVDNVLPTLDRMSEVAAEIEEGATGAPSAGILQTILRLKRSVRQIHRTMVPQKELLNRLSRGELGSYIRPETAPFYRDIYDHLTTIESLNEAIRDSADNSLSAYLSSVSNRQNETMKVMAIVGAIFLPLMLLSGIYGMNFEYMPELHWPWAYFAVLGTMGTVIVVALVLFWRRGWFRLRRPPAPTRRTFTVDREKLRGHRRAQTRRQSPPSNTGANS